MHRPSSVVIGNFPDIDCVIVVQVSPGPGDISPAPGVNDPPGLVPGPRVRGESDTFRVGIETSVCFKVGDLRVIYPFKDRNRLVLGRFVPVVTKDESCGYEKTSHDDRNHNDGEEQDTDPETAAALLSLDTVSLPLCVHESFFIDHTSTHKPISRIEVVMCRCEEV